MLRDDARGTRPFFTIGHSTRSVEEVSDLVLAVGADMIVDVRKMPWSRANPQFNGDALPGALGERQIGYRHIAILGGLRARRAGLAASPNMLWRNQSFRNYADCALTAPFHEGLGLRPCPKTCGPTVVEPTILHEVEPLGPVRFFVEFLRRPDDSGVG